MPSIARDVLKVVAGIIVDADDRVLVTQRPPGRPLAGKWEFPGGKLNPLESPYDGLTRELHEELGVEVRAANRLLRLRHRYPDKDVALDVWRIHAYGGVPSGREGQALAWCDPQRLAEIDLLEADAPIVRALSLPSLYAITDARRFGKEQFLARLTEALSAGLRLVQVREPHMEEAEFIGFARDVASLCHRHGAVVLINGEPAWVAECGADGVHLNTRRLRALGARPLPVSAWVAVSCHGAEELVLAEALGADFAVLGPVRPTRSHPDASPLGWERFTQLRAEAGMPIYALGGLQPRDLIAARTQGAQGLAMITGLWAAPSIRDAVIQASGESAV